MGFLDHVRLWSDVLDPALDEEVAPSLGQVYLKSKSTLYNDSREFFKRTLITKSMLDILEGIASILAGRRSERGIGYHKIYLLTSLFGGGKTHTELTIYHAFKDPDALLEAKTTNREDKERLKAVVKLIKELGRIRIAVIDGSFKELAPTPIDPYIAGNFRINTVWGSIAFQLDSYNLIENYDKELAVPQIDEIRKMLKDKPTLILMDEIARYMVNLENSGSERLVKYANQLIGFLEFLAKAVEISERAVLVVALPIQVKGEDELSVEAGYEITLNLIRGIYKVLTRVAAGIITPVTPADITKVLKTRMFEYVDDQIAKMIAYKLMKTYQDYTALFGDEALKVASEIPNTYPFHPAYIKTLSDIVDKHTLLQKTRTAINLTRKILRILRNINDKAELVMPYHIDVENDEIKAKLLGGPGSHYSSYTMVIEEDIKRRCSDYDPVKQLIAKAVAKTIFARTFVYAWLGGVGKHLYFPDSKEVLINSYEPWMAETLQATSKDYVDALNWLLKNLAYMLESDGRYWFTFLVSPIKQVEIMAKNISDEDAYKVVLEFADRLRTSSVDDILSGRRVRRQNEQIFSSAKLLVESDLVDEDSKAYLLLISLRPLRNDKIYRLIYETRSGRRRYSNTVYVIYPESIDRIKPALWHAKLYIACNNVKDKIGEMYKDELVRKVMLEKLDEYREGRDGVHGRLLYGILASLNKIAYPTFKDNREDVEKTDVSPTITIVESAERALKIVKPQKYYDRLDFDTLDYMLRQIKVDLSESDLVRTVGNIVEFFYTNPRLPMLPEKEVKKALIEGVKMLKIGVKREGKVYYKKIIECRSREGCKPPDLAEGETPSQIQDGDLVLPWRKALEEQVKTLKDVGSREGEIIKRVTHHFYIEGHLVDIKTAMDKFSLDELWQVPIVKLIEELREGIEITLMPAEVRVRPGDKVKVDIVIERIGEFIGEFQLIADAGSLTMDRLRIDENNKRIIVLWSIIVPNSPGEYKYTLKAVHGDNILRETSLRVIVISARYARGAPPADSKISYMVVRGEGLNLKPLAILSKKFGINITVKTSYVRVGWEVGDRKAIVETTLDGLLLEEALEIITKEVNTAGLYIKEVTYEFILKPSKGDHVVAPSFSDEEKKDLEILEYYLAEGD